MYLDSIRLSNFRTFVKETVGAKLAVANPKYAG